MRTENESSRIVDGKVSRPKRVDKQLVKIKKELKRYESIVSDLKMLLDLKAKDRKMISDLISRWLEDISR
jgi:hypothetical protein